MSLQGGKGGLLDALAESDELYQRLLGLKQKYAQAEQELGPHSASLRTRGELPFAFNNIAGVEAAAGAGLAELGEGKSKDQSKLKARRNVRMRSRSDSACMFINGAQLQALMKKVISQIGSCHVDTILEYLRRHWDLVRGGDMIPYNVGECRKHVMQQLRNNTTIFAKDTENEGCWTLSRDEETDSSEIKYYEPQIDCIMRAMEESESGQYSLDYIAAYVIKNWARRYPLSDPEIKDSVKLTLMTNPRFHYDTALPGGLVYLRSKKQNQAWAAGTKKQLAEEEGEEGEEQPAVVSVKKEEEEPAGQSTAMLPPAAVITTASTLMAPPPAPSSPTASGAVSPSSSASPTATAASASTFIFNSTTAEAKVAIVVTDASTSSSESNGKSRKRNRMMTPPAGYACPCGATSAGKGAACKWRKGPDGEFLCNSCGLQLAKKAKGDKKRRDGKHASPNRLTTKKDGKVKKEQQEKDSHEEEDVAEEDEDDEDDDDDDDEEDSPWICCDSCGQWLLAKDDNIDDVSIYDDSNPNHLDYFCPQCREQAADQATECKDEEAQSGKETESTPSREEERWSFGEDNEGEESGMTSSETTPHLGAPNGSSANSRKRGRTASLYSEVDAVKRKVRPRTRSQQNPISADIMGETVSIGGEGKLEAAEHKIRLEWERTVSHQEGEEVDPEVSELEERFWNDIQKYKSLLMQTRDSLWSKNLVDYKKKKEKLKREREKLDAKAESDLMRQFMEYFKKKKRKLVDERESLVSQRTQAPS